jgi:hypothetical protein
MGSVDIPELLIIIGSVAYFAWAAYTWAHRHADLHK